MTRGKSRAASPAGNRSASSARFPLTSKLPVAGIATAVSSTSLGRPLATLSRYSDCGQGGTSSLPVSSWGTGSGGELKNPASLSGTSHSGVARSKK